MTLPKIDARALAWAAESADGRRDTSLVLYRTEGHWALGPETDASRPTAMLRVYTESRKKQVRVPISLPIPTEWDAVFLSESAVEKFLFPYYEAQRLLGPNVMEALKHAYYDDQDVVGIAHIYPSQPKLIHTDGSATLFDVHPSVENTLLAGDA